MTKFFGIVLATLLSSQFAFGMNLALLEENLQLYLQGEMSSEDMVVFILEDPEDLQAISAHWQQTMTSLGIPGISEEMTDEQAKSFFRLMELERALQEEILENNFYKKSFSVAFGFTAAWILGPKVAKWSLSRFLKTGARSSPTPHGIYSAGWIAGASIGGLVGYGGSKKIIGPSLEAFEPPLEP